MVRESSFRIATKACPCRPPCCGQPRVTESSELSYAPTSPLSYAPPPSPCLTSPIPIPLSYVPRPPTCAPDGSDPFVASPKGATAMELAVLSGSAKIVRRFESKALFAGDVDVQVRGARAPCGRHGGRPGVEMSLT